MTSSTPLADRTFTSTYPLRVKKDGTAHLPEAMLRVLLYRNSGKKPKSMVLYGVRSVGMEPGLTLTDFKPEGRAYHVVKLENGTIRLPQKLVDKKKLVCFGAGYEFEIVPKEVKEAYDKTHAKTFRSISRTLDI